MRGAGEWWKEPKEKGGKNSYWFPMWLNFVGVFLSIGPISNPVILDSIFLAEESGKTIKVDVLLVLVDEGMKSCLMVLFSNRLYPFLLFPFLYC